MSSELYPPNYRSFLQNQELSAEAAEDFWQHCVPLGLIDVTVKEYESEYAHYNDASIDDAACDGDSSHEVVEPELESFCKEKELGTRDRMIFIGFLKSRGHGAKTPYQILNQELSNWIESQKHRYV